MSYSHIGSEGSIWFSGISEYVKQFKPLPNIPWTTWTFLSLKTGKYFFS